MMEQISIIGSSREQDKRRGNGYNGNNQKTSEAYNSYEQETGIIVLRGHLRKTTNTETGGDRLSAMPHPERRPRAFYVDDGTARCFSGAFCGNTGFHNIACGGGNIFPFALAYACFARTSS